MERDRTHALGRGRDRAARLDHRRAHPGAARRRTPVVALDDQGPRPRPGRAVRRAGRRDGQGRPERDLRLRVAGGRGREPRGSDLPGSVALPGEQRAEPGPKDQQRAPAGRPDRLGGWGDGHLLDGSDRRRRRGGLRRAAQHLRAHEGDDRERRGRRPLRGPAREREEVRASRGQGAGPDLAVHQDPECRAAGRRRPRRADPARRPDRRRVRDAAHQRRGRVRPSVRRRRGPDPRGVLPDPQRDRDRDRARARVRAVRGRDLVRDLDPGPRRGAHVRRGDPREVPRQAPRLQLLTQLQLAQAPGRRRDRRASSASSEPWATGSSSSRSPGSTP